MTTEADFPPIIRLKTDDTTAFLRAARSGNLEKVIEFLDTDLDINTANSNDLNALHLASKDGHVEIVTELLKRGAKVDAATKKGNTALHIASLAGQSEIVSILVEYGAQVNIQSQNGFTPLYMGAQENHDHVVKILLNNGANQSLATEDGFTPLAVAMQQGHDKVVSVLLENDSKGKVRLPALHIAAKKDDCKAADLLLQNDHKPDVTSKSGFTPLHIAAHYGNEEIARLLIKRGADVNYQAKFLISPLHVAAKWGKNNMVKVLLESGAIIDAKTKDGLTPLHCAARSGHEEVVSTLLENSAPISARSKNGLAPLHMASQGDHVDAARVLLYHRAPVDEVTIDYLTSLHVAAHCGHVRVAKLLLDRKADPNARALNGFTPLHIACKKNRIKVVELLLKHGASIESTTESGLTPLHVASFMGCMNIVIFLLQHEANPDIPTVRGETPLHLAARANQTDIIRILLRNGAKVDARAREQQTPLHIASRLGNVDIVMLLLQHGAAVDTTTKDMYTALHIAAKEGQDEVAAILIDNKASITATTKNGFTPLHIAAKYGNINVTKILMQKDSKLDAQGKNKITPLHLACHYDHPNVAQLLLEKGASTQLSSQNGHTPLHIAARKNQMDTASILLEHGAKANVESKAGFTPLHLSAQKGHYDMTNLLIEHGADPNHKAKNGLTALHLCAQEDFIRVASILVKNGGNIENQTQTGYRPIHVAAHFGNLSMIRFLLKHNAEIDVRNNQMYTPLHQAAQQGHAHVVSALIEGNASHRARTNDGLTALNIAQKLGYISVMEVLKGLSYDGVTPDNKNWEEKYKVIAPESLQETSLMSDSDDEGGSDALISEQPYRYLTADLMKSLRDDSLPIDVTRDDPVHRPVTKEEKQQFVQSNNYCMAENFDSNDNMNLGLHFRSFLVSFLVDARGGTMKGCRHSGIRIIVPPRRAAMPIRVTCRLVKPNKVVNPPPLMEGEALAARIVEMGPVGASFLGPVLIDIPNFAAIRGKDREIIILRSENGENWKEHENSVDNDDTLLNTPYDSQMSALHSGRITRIITTNFPQYFAIVTRIKQEVHVIGSEGGILISSVANHVQAVFPPGALTKKIIVGLQAHVIPAELTAKLLGNSVAVSPVVTVEPRRRKFHKPITLTIPVPQAANKGMINQYGGETPSLRLLCSIAGGTSEAQWEDVTGSTPLTFMNDRVSFTTTVSARFWLMDYRNVCEVPRMATELYKESLYVPFITNFVIYSKRFDLIEATLRILCMTDGKDGLHTLEKQEEFLELVKSRDVEALDSKDLYIEFSGNLVPVTKSGVQLKFTFKSFRQNRISFHVKVKDPTLDPVARMLFMREPKVAKGEAPQQPVCVLNIVLPETISNAVIKKKSPDFEDSNKISHSMDFLKSKYIPDHNEKCDLPKSTSPSEKKFITDTLQKEQTDEATNHESLKKAAYSLESVDASYPNKVSDQEEETLLEKQTYSEKRKFWEDITRNRDSYQRSESEVSRTSQLTFNESDSEYIPNVVSEEDTAAISGRSETMEDMNIPDISECSVAEKAHYFEEQIQKELTTKIPLRSQESLQEKDRSKVPGKSADFKLEKMDLKLDLKLEKIHVDHINFEQKVNLSKTQEKEIQKEKEVQHEKDIQQEKDVQREKYVQQAKEVQQTKDVQQEKAMQQVKDVKQEKDVQQEKDDKKEKDIQRVKNVQQAKDFQQEKELKQENDVQRVKVIQKESDIQHEKDVHRVKDVQQEKCIQQEKDVQQEKYAQQEKYVQQANEVLQAKDIQQAKDVKKEKDIQQEKDFQQAKDVQQEKYVQKEKDIQQEKDFQQEKNVQQEKDVQKEKDIQQEKDFQQEKNVQQEQFFQQVKAIQQENDIQQEKYVLQEKDVQQVKNIQREKDIQHEKAVQLEKDIQREKDLQQEKYVQKERDIQQKKEVQQETDVQLEKDIEQEKYVKQEKDVQQEKVVQQEKDFPNEKDIQQGNDFQQAKDVQQAAKYVQQDKDFQKKKEKEEILSKFDKQGTSQIEGQKEREENLNKKVQQEEIAKKEELSEVLRKEGSLKSVEKEVLDFKESKIPIRMSSHEGKKKEEIFKTEGENLVEEKVEKESKSIPETSEIKKIEKDVKGQKSFEQDFPLVQEDITTLLETKSIKKQENEFKQIKKEFESRIPVSMFKEKEKSPKEDNTIPLKSSTSEVKSPEKAVEPEKKKDFESRIPKRVQEKKEEVKDYVRQEQKTREEVTTSKRKSETQTFSTTFTGHPQDAIKMFEEMSTSTIGPAITSRIDHEASTTREKKETKFSEISKGGDKFLMEEETEHVEKKDISESIIKKQSPDEMIEERECKIKEFDKTALQKISISATAEKQVIDALASQATIQSKDTQKTRLFEDKDKIITETEGVNKLKQSNVDVGMKIERDLLYSKEDIVQVSADENFRKEESKSFDANCILKDVTPSPDPPVTELEARNIAESLIQSIENEIKKRSISSDSLKKDLEDREVIESEGSDDQMADDLTKKFEDIMRKSIAKEELEDPSIQEAILEKDYNDSVSVSEDMTKDEDSYPQDKEGLSSSRFHVTISSNSISDHIDLEDLEANLEGELSRSRKQSESDKPAVVFELETKNEKEPVHSETSGARVLEILEPEYETQSRQDSMDISSLEVDDFRISELKDMKGIQDLEDIEDLEYMQDMEDKDNAPSLHESAAVHSLERIAQEEDRDITMSPSTVSEETNIDFSLPSELPPIRSYTEGGMMSRKGDSFEIHSPPMISPRSKVKDLEIKPINWMIGDEKIEISETLQPSQAFDKELEEYQSAINQSMTMSQTDEQMEFVPESRMETKELFAKTTKSTNEPVIIKSKFTVTKVSDQDLERDLVENKLEASCQKLIATLERERKATTPVDDFLDEMSKTEKLEVLDFSHSMKQSGLKDDLSKAELFEEQVEKSKEPSKTHQPKGEVKSKGKDEFSKGRSFAEDNKRVSERGDKPSHPDHSALKIKKEDLQNVGLSARYAITVLDQVVKKEIAEVKESLEAAKQDLIEELSENSESVFQIKDSPSEFQFKIQPESIPNELPFLYKTPSSEKGSDQDSTPASGSPIIKPRRKNTVKDDDSETFDKKDLSPKSEETSWDFRDDKPTPEKSSTDFIETNQPRSEVPVHRDASFEETYSSSPIPASRSSSEVDKIDSCSLQPQPAPRRRQKPARVSKKIISESEPDSSGESNYQSCDYEIGSGSRPSSSDFEVLQSALSGTSSYETALMSLQHSSSHATSQYQTAPSTMSSRDSIKSLNSLSSGHLGSIDTSELSETLIATETESDDKDVIDDNLEIALDEDPLIITELRILDTTPETESDVPCRMKRSSEMIFPQMSEEALSVEGKPSEEVIEDSMDKETHESTEEIIDQVINEYLEQRDDEIDERIKQGNDNMMKEEIQFSDSSTSTTEVQPGIVESVDIMTARIDEDGIQSVSTQVISREAVVKEFDDQSFEPDSLDRRLSLTGPDEENLDSLQTRTWLQQASMSTSSTSGLSVETVVEKDLQDRNSPDSDSFELVDKPDIIDDFVVVEEVAREAEEFDSEGKSIRISSMTMVKNFDRDVENLITEKVEEPKEGSSDLFEFESEESPPQASNDEQYSQSYSDEEQYEGGKKWIEMQFQSDARLYDIEYERGPLEDIKEEEITDFEGSRFGSIGSHKESIGSVGSMRGSFGSTPDYDTLIGRKYFTKPDHDNISLSSLQEFEHLENVILEGSKKFSSSQDSGTNGSLPRRYGRSSHGDDVSLSSLKDFEGLEKACTETHLMELRAREEEDLLDHESPENKFRLESLAKAKADMSAAGSINQSTSGSDDYEKRIKEIDEIIRIAQANVEKLERQDDTTEDISQIEAEKVAEVPADVVEASKEANVMETSTDSLELEDNAEKKYNLMCRSSDSLELKTTLDFPSLSSDSLNMVKDSRDVLVDVGDRYHADRRISLDSLEIPAHELLESEKQLKPSDSNSNRPSESAIDNSSRQASLKSSTEKTKSTSASGT
ncbi:ankyrin-2-like isoform X1 [Belonocnema kinseyi]|uniref:ankyrin-2-like isoform X1 n=1 Tax=Belonocnema kinseyi TaxID=2817044 RepID=UPI00143CFB05|nr:ankyrin-2-like isoform X1 [Belonocnema kinseyi]